MTALQVREQMSKQMSNKFPTYLYFTVNTGSSWTCLLDKINVQEWSRITVQLKLSFQLKANPVEIVHLLQVRLHVNRPVIDHQGQVTGPRQLSLYQGNNKHVTSTGQQVFWNHNLQEEHVEFWNVPSLTKAFIFWSRLLQHAIIRLLGGGGTKQVTPTWSMSILDLLVVYYDAFVLGGNSNDTVTHLLGSRRVLNMSADVTARLKLLWWRRNMVEILCLRGDTGSQPNLLCPAVGLWDSLTDHGVFSHQPCLMSRRWIKNVIVIVYKTEHWVLKVTLATSLP